MVSEPSLSKATCTMKISLRKGSKKDLKEMLGISELLISHVSPLFY